MSRRWITMTGSAPQARLTMTAMQKAAAPLPRPAAGKPTPAGGMTMSDGRRLR
jgi:hypothetical protein